MIRLERVVNALPAGFDALRAEANAGGFGMLDTLAAEWSSGAMRFDRPGELLLAAYIDDALTGIGGLTQEPAIASALRVRRFYVALAHRRAGIGRALADALLLQAPATTITCNAAPGSESFWQALGFVTDKRDRRTHILRR
jgi:GNAT superfamily N-acetyltransferase